jgi:hypothetical protein
MDLRRISVERQGGGPEWQRTLAAHKHLAAPYLAAGEYRRRLLAEAALARHLTEAGLTPRACRLGRDAVGRWLGGALVAVGAWLHGIGRRPSIGGAVAPGADLAGTR